MLVDPDGLVLICAVCGVIGFAIGWVGGFMDAVQRRREFDAKQRAPGVRVDRPLGCALAMRVMQSDFYKQLDDAERADCDELVRQNLEWFKQDACGVKGLGE